ncbi:cytochrome P450 [Mycobacterium sp.]|jgi:cytochrome P450|uniref:cytochrome P450 n=1 Tax=Mycobacterium sp. TaxID=1785 RepID=UPI002D73985A|nr:cytochrome P450 [Mycobacterium sp.]HZA10898.1 cytochrome P450 [Mycobacterium sp.]
MVIPPPTLDVAALPLAPKNPLPYLLRMKAARMYHTGSEALRDAGGPVTRHALAPNWLTPPFVVTTSPRAAHDVLSLSYPFVDRDLPLFRDQQRLSGGALFNFNHAEWLPRRRLLQPVFTKKHVTRFGGHMAEAANNLASAWPDGADIDLDAQARKLTLRALGRSVLAVDLDSQADDLGNALRVVQDYVSDRGWRPVRAPSWFPTPARRRARSAIAVFDRLAMDIIGACRRDPDVEAPLVRALIAATDPATGRPLTDNDIAHELVVFMAAGHDTTATTLTYALWALGHHPDIQNRVLAEVAELGDRQLTPDDVSSLGFTVQVLNEALRLCPPAPITVRLAMKDIAVDGYRVPAGTLVVVGIYAMHRDPKLWTDPLTFDPDRFAPEQSKSRDRWQYIPFGAGPRSCIGDHFAMLEATLGLATIIRSVEICSDDDDFAVAVPFTLVAGGPIRAHVRRRSTLVPA